MTTINLSAWCGYFRSHDWYTRIAPEFLAIEALRDANSDQYKILKEKAYGITEACLLADSIALGARGENQDKERKRVDTVIIHHTGGEPGVKHSRLSAMHLLRLYAPVYYRKYSGVYRARPRSIYSHHFVGSKQVFYAYHWLVRENGNTERLLPDNAIGWHAGDWSVNCRSIAICIDGNYERETPSQRVLEAVASIIAGRYAHVREERVLGHCEVRSDRTCPSQLFVGTSGWKRDILARLQ